MRFLIFISNIIERRYYWHFNASLYYNPWDIYNVAEFVFQIGSVGNLTPNTIYWKRWIIIAIGHVANWLMLLWELDGYHRSGILTWGWLWSFLYNFTGTPLILRPLLYHHWTKETLPDVCFWSSASLPLEIYDKINRVWITILLVL